MKMDTLSKDDRFKHVSKDPRFRKMRKQNRKVKIDKRFKGMLTDKNFKLKYVVDPRGRPINATTNENLRRFYDLSDSGVSDNDSSEGEDNAICKKDSKPEGRKKGNDGEGTSKERKEKVDPKQNATKSAKTQEVKNQPTAKQAGLNTTSSVQQQKPKTHKQQNKDEQTDEEDVDDESDRNSFVASSPEDHLAANVDPEEAADSETGSDGEETEEDDDMSSVDYARGGGDVESSTDDDDISDEEEEDGEFDHNWGELDTNAVQDVTATSRLAICNMDWDRIKASDLMVLLTSFLPPGGIIHSVIIYPSEYGLARLAEEDAQGPQELVSSKKMDEATSKKSSKQTEEGGEYHRERLRQYQLNRLRYYYAVAECDSVGTADHIYTQCDGMEYESSSSRLDLRFIPEDMTFEQTPHSKATDVPEATTYKPSLFTTDALQQSKVSLTWDETDHDRVAVTMKKITKDDLEDLDVKAYLATDSETEDDGNPYAGLEDAGFTPGSDVDSGEDEEGQIEKYRALLRSIKDTEEEKQEGDKDMEITWEPGLKESTEEMVKTKNKKAEKMTPWEEFLEKKREKKKEKLEKKKKVAEDAEEAKNNQDEQAAFSDDDIPGGIDLEDPYFKDSLADPDSKGQEKKKKKKGKKRKQQSVEEDGKDAGELSLLLMDEEPEPPGTSHFSLSAIQAAEKKESRRQRKRKLRKKQQTDGTDLKQDDFKVDVQDERFHELFDNPLFNIDPSAPEFKKTKAMEAVIEEKVKRRKLQKGKPPNPTDQKGNIKFTDGGKYLEDKSDMGSKGSKKSTDQSLASLVKSVKAKTKSLQEKKGKR